MDKTLLIVDDDPRSRRALEKVLSDSGWEIRHASDGREALDIVRSTRQSIYVLIVDLVMPDVDGFELMRQLESEGMQPVGIVLISGNPYKAVVERFLECGSERVIPFGFFWKPLVAEQVKSLVRGAMDIIDERMKTNIKQ